MNDVPEWDETEPAPPMVTGVPGKLAGKLPPRPGAVPADEAPPAPADGPSSQVDEPTLFYGNVDEFVREKLRYLYVRRVGPQREFRWSARWWSYPEAISRLDALWRSWEALRLDPAFGMSVWWRDHADHHMRVLLDPSGPFSADSGTNEASEPLPYEAPPAGMFVDVRQLDL